MVKCYRLHIIQVYSPTISYIAEKVTYLFEAASVHQKAKILQHINNVILECYNLGEKRKMNSQWEIIDTGCVMKETD